MWVDKRGNDSDRHRHMQQTMLPFDYHCQCWGTTPVVHRNVQQYSPLSILTDGGDADTMLLMRFGILIVGCQKMRVRGR